MRRLHRLLRVFLWLLVIVCRSASLMIVAMALWGILIFLFPRQFDVPHGGMLLLPGVLMFLCVGTVLLWLLPSFAVSIHEIRQPAPSLPWTAISRGDLRIRGRE